MSEHHPESTSYVHRDGTRQYLEAEVLPHIRPALAALLHKMQAERLQLAAGMGFEDGRFRAQNWRPFCPQEWLANYMLDQKRSSMDAAAAANKASLTDATNPG